MIGFWWLGGNYLCGVRVKHKHNCLILLQDYQKKNPQLLGVNSTGKCRGSGVPQETALSLSPLGRPGNLLLRALQAHARGHIRTVAGQAMRRNPFVYSWLRNWVRASRN